LKPRWSVQRRLPLSWTVLRSSFLPRFSHRLLALALWFIFFQLGFFTSFFSSFTYRWKAFNCPAFIEFTLCNGAWGRVTPNNEELLSNCPKVGGRPVNQDTDWEVETTDGKNRRECIQHDLLGLSKLTGLRCLGHVLTHQGFLHIEHRRDHQDDQDDRYDHDIEVKVFADVIFQHIELGRA